MSFTIDVKSDINKIARYMDNIEKKQLPFAVNLTLNKIALLVQEQICKRVPIRLILPTFRKKVELKCHIVAV